jgi:hypothetical protein
MMGGVEAELLTDPVHARLLFLLMGEQLPTPAPCFGGEA